MRFENWSSLPWRYRFDIPNHSWVIGGCEKSQRAPPPSILECCANKAVQGRISQSPAKTNNQTYFDRSQDIFVNPIRPWQTFIFKKKNVSFFMFQKSLDISMRGMESSLWILKFYIDCVFFAFDIVIVLWDIRVQRIAKITPFPPYQA